MTFHAVVPAAGLGKRMGSDFPKQYLSLNGRMVIDWSIQALLNQPGIETVTVALGREDDLWPTTKSIADPRVTSVAGGAERCHSVLNALQDLLGRAAEDDWVLVHDAARPCVSRQDLSRLMELAQEGTGGLLGVPVHDTMKRTDETGSIIATVDRDCLWHAQTPQMFPLNVLRKALADALVAGVTVTDEASAMEWAGYQPRMVEGSASNIKITRPADLELAGFYLAG
ncbi:MAG TPA: 2-C-methyl-D-erythritol 4-phosphate cytidylyltransferase [Chromatiaceae bacterium]|nr:2-C-methyl-D-erythritol 4-phosphate cytidylyltransferase [Chromatiaceae bacterium]